MSTETLTLMGTMVTAVVSATWVLRSKLSDVEKALGTHAAHDEMRFSAQDARIVKLERRRR